MTTARRKPQSEIWRVTTRWQWWTRHISFLPADVRNKAKVTSWSRHQTPRRQHGPRCLHSYNLNVTDSSACQRRRGGEKNKKNKQKTNLTQIYKNMPLDSYQQLRTVGALFTEKKAIYTNIYNNKDFFHIRTWGGYWHVAESYSDDRMSLLWRWKMTRRSRFFTWQMVHASFMTHSFCFASNLRCV